MRLFAENLTVFLLEKRAIRVLDGERVINEGGINCEALVLPTGGFLTTSHCATPSLNVRFP